jgi:hypothetical protein
MTLWTDVFANNLVVYLQVILLLTTIYFIVNEIQIAKGRKITFNHFLTNQKFYNLPSPRLVQIIILSLLVIQFILMLLALTGNGILYAALYVINIAVTSILWLFSLNAEVGNCDIEKFSSEYRAISRMNSSLEQKQVTIATMQEELDSIESKVQQTRKDFTKFTTKPIFNRSNELTRQLSVALDTAKNNNIAKQVQTLKNDFEIRLIQFINQGTYTHVSLEEQEIPGVHEFEVLLTHSSDVIQEDIKEISDLLFSDFSAFDDTSIIEIIEIAEKYNFSVTEIEIRRILDRVAQLTNKQELLNRLYKANAITAEIIITYLEKNQDWIITPQMYEILNQGNLSNVLSLLISKDLIESAKRFLQSLPANKLQILYRVTGEVKNATSSLILEFRHYLPLKYMFSDPSTMYFNMFSALKNSDEDLITMMDDTDQQVLRKGLIVNQKIIQEKYELSYQNSASLRSQFEAVKLNLISSNLTQSKLIRLESSIELFYQYVVNLRQKEAKVLFEFLESIFFIEETDKFKVEDFIKNKGTSPNSTMTISKYVETGRSKLRQLLRTEKNLLRQIISRVEVQRLGYDELEAMVRA